MAAIALQPLKEAHNITRSVRQLVEDWNHQLSCPPSGIPERYIRSDLAVLIKLSFERGGKRAACTAHIALELPSEGELVVGEHGKSLSVDNHQFAVLIDNVHMMDDRNQGVFRIIRTSTVRLKPHDDLASAKGGDSLYFSYYLGVPEFLSWPRFKHGKFNVAPIPAFAVRNRRDLPHEMVQARSKVMGNFASKHAESDWDLSAL
jgi:hypothetical protein